MELSKLLQIWFTGHLYTITCGVMSYIKMASPGYSRFAVTDYCYYAEVRYAT